MQKRAYLDAKNLVLLTYDPRSGSTYLATRLDEFEDISVSVETYFLQNLIGFHEDDLKNPEKILAVLHSKDFRLKNIMKQPDYFYDFYSEFSHMTHYDLAKCLLSSYFTDRDAAKTWIIKCGIAGWHIFNILDKMPQMKFIHILRDGRGVLNSKLTTQRAYRPGTMSQEPLTPALKWRSWIRHIDSFSEAFPNSIHEVKYEDLLVNTETELNRLRFFMGLDRKPAPDPKTDGIVYKEKIPETEKRMHVNLGHGPVRDNIDKWRSNLKKGDVMLFEYLTRRMLVAKGYRPIYIKNNRIPWKRFAFWTSLISSVMKYVYRKVSHLFTKTARLIFHSCPANSEKAASVKSSISD